MKKPEKNYRQELQERKIRVKEQLAAKEKTINERINYLDENFGNMALHSLLPLSEPQIDRVSGTFDKINTFLVGIMPGENRDVKEERLNHLIKPLQLAATGLIYRFLKKYL